MRRKTLFLTAGLAALLTLLVVRIPEASAHGWRWGGPFSGSYYGGYHGLGAHDFVPHWHSYITPFGGYSYGSSQ